MRLPPAPADLGQYLNGYGPSTIHRDYRANWSLGKLVGDTELPDDVEVRDVNGSGATGWYEIWLRGVRIGTLRPGGSNGRFLRMAPDPPLPGLVSVAPAPPPIVATTSAPTQQQPIVAAITQPAIVTATQPARAEVIPVVNTTPAPPPIYPSAPAVTTLVEASGAPVAPIADDTSTVATTATSSNTNKLLGLAAVGVGGYFVAKKLRWIK